MCRREGCIYLTAAFGGSERGNRPCNYLNMTGKSRYKKICEELKKDTRTGWKDKRVMRRLEGKNCPFYTTEQKPKPEKQEIKRGPKKTFDRSAAMELYQRGMVDREIGEALGVSQQAVCIWRNSNNLAPNIRPDLRAGGPRQKYDRTRMAELYLEGKTDYQIADELDCSPETVRKWRNAQSLPGNKI